MRENLLLGENTEKYITSSVPVEKKVIKISKNEEEIAKAISYIFKFIDSARFMAGLLIILLREFIKLNVNRDMMIKNVKLAELNINANIQVLKVI